MSDNYECMKTNEPQSQTDYSSYTDKQYSNYINDINGGSYSKSSHFLILYIYFFIFKIRSDLPYNFGPCHLILTPCVTYRT